MPSTVAPVTRGTLVTRARQRADYLNSSFIDATINEDYNLVDTSLAKLHNILVSLYEDYFSAFYTANILANIDTYPLPADWYKLRQVFYVDSSGARWPLNRLNVSDLTTLPQSTSYTQPLFGYAMLGPNLIISPKPTTAPSPACQLLVLYIPQYKPVISDNEPIEYGFAFGWDEWVVNDVAYAFRLKANEPAEEIFREREKLEATIREQARHRNAGDPPRVRDTGYGTSWVSRYGQFAIR